MKYCPELDGLRCLAATAVILLHSGLGGPFRGGYIGVDVFFVLSGFLITSLLVAEYELQGRINLLNFYRRRFLRLMPALLFLLVIYIAIAPFVWPGWPHTRDAVLAGLYVSDYTLTFTTAPKYLGHTWSLSVEEQFYLLWPLLLAPLLRSRRPLGVLIWAFIVATTWRALFAWDWQLYFFRFDTHATGLIAGAALAFALPNLKPSPRWSMVGAMALLALCLIASKDWTWAAISLAEAASILLISAAVTGNAGIIGRLLRHPLLVQGGKVSYALYLWHYPFVAYLRTRWDFLPTAMATMLFSVSMAVISYYSVEAWAKRLRQPNRLARPLPDSSEAL